MASDQKADVFARAIFKALEFAARKHRDQRRKGSDASPYINHPIQVANVLTTVGGIDDVATLQAAVLHDTVEDTDTTRAELGKHFGTVVRALVEEITDDKSLPKDERKRLQIEHAPKLSDRATLIKLADKICNVDDLGRSPPASWDSARREAYFDWAEQVVAACRDVNKPLKVHFTQRLLAARAKLGRRANG